MRAGEFVLRLVFLAATKGTKTNLLNRREQRNDFHSKAAKTEEFLQKLAKFHRKLRQTKAGKPFVTFFAFCKIFSVFAALL
jgi:hypothetical protein